MSAPLFSVVIPTCDRNPDLAKCLECLSPKGATVSPDLYEVIVSDDSGVSSAREVVETEFPWAQWVKGPQRGPAANRNYGASLAKGQWLAFTDDDCLPAQDWLEKLLESHENRDVLEGLTRADRTQLTFAEEAPINLTGGLLWSCNFAIKRSVFEELDGFDEKFPYAAMEDVDFRERLKLAGKTLTFCPNAVVVHPWRKRKGWAHWNRHYASLSYFWRKHPRQKPKSIRKYFALLALKNSTTWIWKNSEVRMLRGVHVQLLHSLWLLCRTVSPSSPPASKP